MMVVPPRTSVGFVIGSPGYVTESMFTAEQVEFLMNVMSHVFDELMTLERGRVGSIPSLRDSTRDEIKRRFSEVMVKRI